MKTLRSLLLIICSALLIGGCQQREKVVVHIIGDSTMADYVENTTRTRGWGEMLQEFVAPELTVANYARGGRSSHSFYKEGRWKWVTDSLKAGDYVFIQFAHNDEKEGGKDGADGRGTAPWTTYKSYLERYVDETRAAGGNPVLITPIIRRYFTADGTISPKGCHDLSIAPDDSTLNYVRVMKQVARNKQVPLVDMTALTKTFSEQLGAERTTRCIYVPTDGTHTQATGAACYAQLAVAALKEQGILADYMRPETPLVLNPASLDFKTIFAGEESVCCFDLTGLQLTPAEGRLTVTAPEGMLIADTPDGAPQPELHFDYQGGQLWNRCLYLHFTPVAGGSVETAVTIRYSNQTRLLPVVATIREVTAQHPFQWEGEPSAARELTLFGERGYAPEKGVWTAEMDEYAKRYVELVIPASDQTRLLRQLSFTLEGEVACRVACAYGKDFYPRTDLGEIQQPQSGRQQITWPMNVILHAGQQLHIRLFPWSTKATTRCHFTASGWCVEGVVLE